MDKDISCINQHLKSQRIGWIIKRISWVGMAMLLLFGLLGGLGESDGILNEKTIRIDGVQIEYEKFLRVQKSFEMKVIIEKAVIDDLSISINKEYIDKVQITQIIPSPKHVEVTDAQIIYTFNSFKKGTITFFNDPIRMGNQKLEIEINRNKVSFFQYIYF